VTASRRANDGGGLEQELLVVREPVDPGGEHGLDGRRHLEVLEPPRQAVGAVLADEHLGLGERAHDLLEEVRVAPAPLDQELSERP